MNLSRHFTLAEFEASEYAARHGIGNTMPDECRMAAIALCENILEPLRSALGPLHVNSGYRSYRLNSAIGGAKASQHLLGEAADVIPLAMGVRVIDLVVWLYRNAPYDQIIDEFGGAWCHVSYRADVPGRRQVLAAARGKFGTVYAPLTEEQVLALA